MRPEPTVSDQAELSGIERIKAASDYLRGSVAIESTNGSDSFQPDTVQLLKHHGMYQQGDRDLREARHSDATKPPKAYSMMVRSKIPGGKLTSRQLVSHLDLCDELADGTLRITTRQGLQLHGVRKRNLRRVIRRINEAGLTTLGASGDVGRNVMCCPAPYRQDPVHDQIERLADRLSASLLPRTSAYGEIWLVDPHAAEKHPRGEGPNGQEIEPLYGKSYLPRKFKIGIALSGDNCIDVYTHDLGLLAICEDFNVVGYNLLVGGGMGVTPGNEQTFPALARPMAFVAPEEVVDVAMAVVKVFRDFGNRSDRRRARLKYLIADWGLDRFKAKVEEYCGRRLPGPRPVEVREVDDHVGWHEQGDGRWFYGVSVENGRIADRDGAELKSALREICRTWRPGIRLTAQQNLLLTDVDYEHRPAIEDVFRRHGVKLDHEISNVRRCSMACVALPTCPMAISESERVLPGLINRLERELAELGLAGETFALRMTGCPNGCARPYNADIGLVGRSPGKYTIYLGGRVRGDRLGFVYKDKVPLDEIVATLVPLLASFRERRHEGEGFGDFCHRQGALELAAGAERDAVVRC